MKVSFRFLLGFLCLFLFESCQSSRVINSYRKGNNYYIENIDTDGNIIGIDNIVINNCTFFSIDFIIYGLNDLSSKPKLICSKNVQMRTNLKIFLYEDISNYKYILVKFPNGTLKKCTSFVENNDMYIEIEQYGIEKNEEQNRIDEDLLEEVESVFSKYNQ